MCGFCHAPEHAYDTLAEHPEINRDELCDEARERLLMASTPYPDEKDGMRTTGLESEWDEDAHAWEAIRDWRSCTQCGGRTWQKPDETMPFTCKACGERELALFLQVRLLLHGSPATAEERAEFEEHLPDRKGVLYVDRLRFSDYEVRNTRDFDYEPGPRSWQPRPRVTIALRSSEDAKCSRLVPERERE